MRLGLEAGVHHDHAIAGLELVVGDRLDQGQADPLGDRRLARLDLDGDQARLADRLELPLRRAGHQDRHLAALRPERVPVHGPSGRIRMPEAPDRRAASHASGRKARARSPWTRHSASRRLRRGIGFADR